MASPSAGMIINIIVAVLALILFIIFTANIYFYWTAYRGNCQAIGETNSGFLVMLNLVGMLLSAVIFIMALVAIFVDHKSKTPKMPGYNTKDIGPLPSPPPAPTPAAGVPDLGSLSSF
jgi:uncharacterized membrane protein